jgi:hypothetical protein
VVIQHTGPRGLTASVQVIARSTPGVPGDPVHDTYFGSDLASGDFNGDGFADLAVIDGTYLEGRTTIVYGSPNGLDASTATEATDQDGPVYSVAAGDVDGDGFADIALATWARVDPHMDPRVMLLRGGPSGTEPAPVAVYEIDGSWMRFSDVDDDGKADLVAAGYSSLALCPGTESGIGACSTLPANGYPSDLAVGNVSGDRRNEILVGQTEGAGGVHVYGLTSDGLRHAFRIDQTTRGVPGNPQEGDAFGAAVEVGPIGRDRHADIAIGAPGEDRMGRVTIVHGAKRAIARRGNYAIHQNHPGVPGKGRPNDWFGGALALLDHDGNRRLDLDIGATGESRFTGRTTVLYAPLGKHPKGAQAFGLETFGLPPVAEAGYGAVLGRP